MKIAGKRNVYLGDFEENSGGLTSTNEEAAYSIPENSNNAQPSKLIISEEETSEEVLPIDEGFDSTTDHITDKVSDDISTHSESGVQVMTAMTAKDNSEQIVTVTTESATLTAAEPMSTKKKVAIGAVALLGAYWLMKE